MQTTITELLIILLVVLKTTQVLAQVVKRDKAIGNTDFNFFRRAHNRRVVIVRNLSI